MSTPRTQPTLGDLLDLAQQLDLDAAASGSTLRHRDRPIGQDLAHHERRPLQQLLGWLHRVRELGKSPRGDRVNTVHRLGLLVAALAGLAAGWGTAAVVFFYDGTHPVNVIHVLAVFVLLPLVLLVFFGFSLLPRRVTRFVPGMGAVQDAMGLLSPGRLQHLMARYLPQGYRDTLASLLGKGQAHQKLYGRVDRWVATHTSQTFALAFNVGALVSCLYLITFSDLAFSWSTTLQFDATRLKQWTDVLSAPWSFFFADARPSHELIASTRYFRLGDGSFPAAQSPSGLGGWWPFLVMCMAVYGVLPRLLTLWLAQARMRVALRQTFLHFPGLDDVRMRLNSELVETRAEEPERDGERLATGGSLTEQANVAGLPGIVIAWSAAAPDRGLFQTWLAGAAGIAVDGWHEAGGTRSLNNDRAAMDAAVAQDGNLFVVVKAWEPPMAEFLDFLSELRAAAGDRRAIHVLPVGTTRDGSPSVAESRHHDLWYRVLTGLGDPWLSLTRLGSDDV